MSDTTDGRRETTADTFTCPMHPEVRADKPGPCPKCGMALEPRGQRWKEETVRKHSVAVALGAVIVLGLLLIEPAQAIPAFARREGVKCQMCHFRVPELNEDGHAYLRRGLREKAPGAMSGMEEPGAKKEAGRMGECRKSR